MDRSRGIDQGDGRIGVIERNRIPVAFRPTHNPTGMSVGDFEDFSIQVDRDEPPASRNPGCPYPCGIFDCSRQGRLDLGRTAVDKSEFTRTGPQKGPMTV